MKKRIKKDKKRKSKTSLTKESVLKSHRKISLLGNGQKMDKTQFKKISEKSKLIDKIISNSSPITTYTFFFLTTALQTSIFMSSIYTELIQEYSQNFKNNIHTLFNKSSQYFDILNMTATFKGNSLIVFTAIILILSGFCIFFVIKIKHILMKMSLDLESRIIKIPLIVFSTIILNFDFFFFFLNNLSIGNLICKTVLVEAMKGSKSSDNFILSSGLDSSFEFDESEFSIQLVPKSILLSTQEIECKSNKHFILGGISSILIIISLAGKLFSEKILRFVIKEKMKNYRIGIGHKINDFMLLILMMISAGVKSGEIIKGEGALDLSYYLFGAICLLCYIISYKTKGGYIDQKLASLEIFKWGFFSTLVIFSIITRKLKFQNFNSENTSGILLLIFSSVNLKISYNLLKVYNSTWLEKIQNHFELSEQETLKLYYQVKNYLDYIISKNSSKMTISPFSSSNRSEEILISILSDQHKKSCKNIECWCRNKDKYLNGLNSCELIKNSLYFIESIFLIEELLLSKIEKQRIFEENSQILNNYIEFLIHYKGDFIRAYGLITKHGVKNNKKEYQLDLEYGCLLYWLNKAGERNLRNGILFMNSKEKYLKDSIIPSLINYKEEFIFLEHIYFLDKLEKMKKKILKCGKFKAEVMEELSKKICDVENVMEISSKFHFEKKKILDDFDSLEEVCGNQYFPLFIVFGNHLTYIVEDRIFGAKIYSRIKNSTKFKDNLNWALRSRNLLSTMLEFLAIYIDADKDSKNFHIIDYISSNVASILGWFFMSSLF